MVASSYPLLGGVRLFGGLNRYVENEPRAMFDGTVMDCKAVRIVTAGCIAASISPKRLCSLNLKPPCSSSWVLGSRKPVQTSSCHQHLGTSSLTWQPESLMEEWFLELRGSCCYCSLKFILQLRPIELCFLGTGLRGAALESEPCPSGKGVGCAE